MSNRLRLRIVHALIVVLGIAIGNAASAACYPAGSKLANAQIDAFVKNPGALLAAYEYGGGGLVAAVRDLVASDSATLPVVIQLLKSANPQQRASIGTGLGFAAQICLVPEQAYAGQIQAALAETADTVALTAFVATAGQTTGTSALAGNGTGAAKENPTPGRVFVNTPTTNTDGVASGRAFFPLTFSGSSITRGSTVTHPVSP
jgi:hypothetical protein